MKWLACQAPLLSCRQASGMSAAAKGKAHTDSGHPRTELSQSSIRARWRIGWSPSTGRNRSDEVEVPCGAAAAPEVIVRDHRLWTAGTREVLGSAMGAAPYMDRWGS